MERLTKTKAKNKKRILDDQLSFNFEENIVEHYYKEKTQSKNIEIKTVTLFRKENRPIKKCHLKRKVRNI